MAAPTEIHASEDPTVHKVEDLPTDEDLAWARRQTSEIIRRARELDIGVELEEMGR